MPPNKALKLTRLSAAPGLSSTTARTEAPPHAPEGASAGAPPRSLSPVFDGPSEGHAASGRNESMTRAQVERGTLLLLMAINGVMFIVELVTGWVAQSMGLIA